MKLRLSILFLTLALLLAPLGSAEERDPVRIALVDSGISALAIDASHVAEGQNYVLPGETTDDTLGHGTAVASIIVGSQSAGIPGLCPEAVLVPLNSLTLDRFGFTQGVDSDQLAVIIRDAIDVYNCDIINISMVSNYPSEALEEAVAYAAEQGVMIVSASGNDGSGLINYPSGYESVFCVGTVNEDGTRQALFSTRHENLDLLAPGVDIPVAGLWGEPTVNTGTSFSSAYVTGVAAKLMTLHPHLSAAQIQRILRASATDLLTRGFDKRTGWGVVDVANAISYAANGRQYRDLPDDLWFSPHVSPLSSPTMRESVVSRAHLWVVLHAMSGEKASPEAENWYTDAQNWVRSTGIADSYFPEKPLTYEEVTTILSAYAAHMGYEIAFDLPLPLEPRATRGQVSALLEYLENLSA